MTSSVEFCSECGQSATRLRKDRCDACYMRLYRSGELPAQARCVVCRQDQKRFLLNTKIAELDAVLCGNCALVHKRSRPRAKTVADLSVRVRPSVAAPVVGSTPPIRPSFDPALD